MSFHAAYKYAAAKMELTQTMLRAAAIYIKKRRFSPLDVTKLDQMSQPMDEISGEILAFGADAWPKTVENDDSEKSCGHNGGSKGG